MSDFGGLYFRTQHELRRDIPDLGCSQVAHLEKLEIIDPENGIVFLSMLWLGMENRGN